ncbi:MAG: hypothetical protein KDC54_01375, partial [Lewinella sp.]|nr:hypothetical protein [Lewinella sp.]
MPYRILCLSLLAAVLTGPILPAQDAPWQWGVMGETTLHLTPSDQAHLGHGTTLGLWLGKSLDTHHGFRLGLAYRLHSHYRLAGLTLTEQYFPGELRR